MARTPFELDSPIRIQRLELHHVAMPLTEPFRTAFGEMPTIHSILVRAVTAGDEAWAESAPFESPIYGPEWAGGVFACIRDWLAPRILGKDLRSGAELQRELASIRGNRFAKAALDIAWWTLAARQAAMPLHKALGGVRNETEVGAVLGVMASNDDLIEAVDRSIAAGYRRLKLKVRPGRDLDAVRAVRSTYPDLMLHIDCNAEYTLDDWPLFRSIDRLGLAMIEQPLGHDDLLDHAKLQARLETPVCLDESIHSVTDVQHALELGSCRYVNIKPGRVGGLTESLRVLGACRDAGVPCWVGGMLESAVGAACCLAVGTLENIDYPSDIFPSTRFYEQDLAGPDLSFVRPQGGGVFAVADDAPGLPQKPRPEVLRRQTVEFAAVTEA